MSNKAIKVSGASAIKNQQLPSIAEIKKNLIAEEPISFDSGSLVNNNDLLQRLSDVNAQAQRSAEFFKDYDKRNEQAFVKDEELDTLRGALNNQAIGLAQGVAQMASNAVGAANNFEANKYLSKLDDLTRIALGKPEDQLTPEERELLNKPIDVGTPELSKFGVGINYVPDYKTPKEIYAAYTKEQNNAQLVKDKLTKDTFITNSFNNLNRKKLIENLDDTWEEIDKDFTDAEGAFDVSKVVLSGIGKTIGALAQNPAATIEYAVESAPHMLTALNPITAAANSTSYGLDILGQNLRNIEKETGQLVNKDKQSELAGEAVLASALE